MEQMQQDPQKNSGRSWRDIVYDLGMALFRNAENSIERMVKEREERFIRKVIAVLMMIFGFFYGLIGVTLLINDAFGRGQWPGFIIIGILLAVFGYSIKNK